MQLDPGYKLVELPNGARSIHSLAYGETFHPVIGPVLEAEALYVRQLHLSERVAQHSGEFVIWDVGLGAAANALTVLRATRLFPARIRLISFDQTLQPLRFAHDHAGALGYLDGYESQIATLASGRGAIQFIDGVQTVDWDVHLGDFPQLIESQAAAQLHKPHVILFDAYSPATNPAMWTERLFTGIFQLLDPARGCLMPTYSRSTLLRVTLLLAGFYVGKGGATGEKEETTVAANRADLIPEPLDKRWLKRARNSTSAEPLREPIYRQMPLSEASWAMLLAHPQFA